MVERLMRKGTSHSSRDLLKIWVKIEASWSENKEKQSTRKHCTKAAIHRAILNQQSQQQHHNRTQCCVIHKCISWFIYKCHIYLQTNECAFTNRSPFVNIPAFISGFLTLSWCGLIHKCIFFKKTFSAAYQMSLTQPIQPIAWSIVLGWGPKAWDLTATGRLSELCDIYTWIRKYTMTFLCKFGNYSNSIHHQWW